jgi:hypothetical protein
MISMNNKSKLILGLVIILGIMIINDFSLHLVELLKIEKVHPLYSFFWSLSPRSVYTTFWTVHWGIASLIIFFLGVLIYQELK